MIVGCCFGEAQLSSTPNLVLNAQVHLEYAVGRNVMKCETRLSSGDYF